MANPQLETVLHIYVLFPRPPSVLSPRSTHVFLSRLCQPKAGCIRYYCRARIGWGEAEIVPDDQECHEKLYREQHARILRLCRLLLRNQQEAEEVAQEVFLKLTQARAVQQRDSWDAWLTQVVVNA